MSPAQSEDSGLAADRSSTYATISIPRENAQAMGIIFAGESVRGFYFIPQLIWTPASSETHQSGQIELVNPHIKYFLHLLSTLMKIRSTVKLKT
jgi:hypothetical protein